MPKISKKYNIKTPSSNKNRKKSTINAIVRKKIPKNLKTRQIRNLKGKPIYKKANDFTFSFTLVAGYLLTRTLFYAVRFADCFIALITAKRTGKKFLMKKIEKLLGNKLAPFVLEGVCHIHSSVNACVSMPAVEKTCRDISNKLKHNNQYKAEKKKILLELGRLFITKPSDINSEVISLIEKNSKALIAESLLHIHDVTLAKGGMRALSESGVYARLLFTIVLLRKSGFKSGVNSATLPSDISALEKQQKISDKAMRTRLSEGGSDKDDVKTFLDILEIPESVISSDLSKKSDFLHLALANMPLGIEEDIDALYTPNNIGYLTKSEGESGVKYRLKGGFFYENTGAMHVFYANRESDGTWKAYDIAKRSLVKEFIPSEIDGKISVDSKGTMLNSVIMERVS